MVISIFGNGILLLLLIHFKALRTVPNILIANLAAIDAMNAVINMPLMISWYICKDARLKGKVISWLVVSTYVLFIYLTAFSLVVLMMDRYGAICHGLKYHTWKTKRKAYAAAAITWVCAGLYTYVQFSLGLNIDVGDQPVLVYRKFYFQRFGRPFIIPGYLVPFSIILVLTLLVWRRVRMRKTIIAPYCSLSIKKRGDVVTAKTIGLIILCYFFTGCFPMLLHNIARIHGSWLHFLAYFFIHMNSLANPVIYSLRTRRFRQAFKILIQDTFGTAEAADLRRLKVQGASTTYTQ